MESQIAQPDEPYQLYQPEELQQGQFVYLRWVDSCVNNGEMSESEIEHVAEMYTAGVFIKETDEYVTLARDQHRAGLKDSWRDVISIPRVCILFMCELTPGREFIK